MSTSSSNAAPKQRLMISKMELENFKSYAGTQAIGPFHKSFSSIVGPNGSGKSNVIDALLFVFGKRAKQLRLNKVSELIHKSSRFPNLEYARVSVYFQLIVDKEQSEDDFDVVSNSEFVITRIAYTNNTSKYLVDNKTSSFTEVGKLLRDYGVDLDNNRFLILQGEVEQIAMMKPKAATPHEEGLLEYLEDIIGSNQFVEKIEESSKKLDAINEQRVEKVHRLKVAEKERDNLHDAKAEAEGFLEKEKEIRRKKNILYQLYAKIASDNIQDFTEKLNAAQEKLTYEKNKMKDTEHKLQKLEKTYQAVKKEHTEVEKDLQSASTKYDAFERRDVKLQEDMKHSRANIKKFQAQVQKEEKKEEESLKEAEQLLVQIQKYQQTLSDFESKKVEEEQALAQLMESLQEETADLRHQLEQAQMRVAQEEKAVSSLQTQKDLMENEKKLLLSRQDKAQRQFAQDSEKLTQLRASKEQDLATFTKLQNYENSDFQPQLVQLQQKAQSLAAEEERVQETIRQRRREVEDARAVLASAQSKGSANKVVQQLLQAARPGGMLSRAGIRGRLGDLGCINSQYDVAITTACKSLNDIVVETAKGAEECVKFLRDRNLGRATFMVLEQMQDWRERMNRAVRTPENTPRLFDLIEDVDEDVKTAFYFALRDTLVSPDLEHATRIAYVGEKTQWRVVTLSGQLIDTSGTMSGGGSEVRKGGMLLSGQRSNKASKNHNAGSGSDETVSEQSIRQLEASIQELQQQLSAIRKDKTEVEFQIKDLQQNFKQTQTQLTKLRMALERYEDQEQTLARKLTEMQNQMRLTPEEEASLQQLNQQLETMEQEISKVAPNLRATQMEVQSLTRQIKSYGGPKQQKIQAKIDSYNHQIESLSTTVSTKQVDEADLRKQVDKASQAKAKAQQDLQKSEEKLEGLLKEQKEMEDDALQVVEALEAAKAKLAELEGQLESSAKEYHDMKAAVSKIKEVEFDLTAEVDKIKHDLHEETSTRDRWTKEAEAIRAVHSQEHAEFVSTVKTETAKILASHKKATETTASSSASANAGSTAMDVDEADHDDEEDTDDLPIYPAEELVEYKSEDLKRDINVLETERNKLKGNLNMNALLEYMRKDANYKIRLAELEEINAQRAVLRDEYESLRRQRLDMFMAGFGQISLRLKEMYQMITLGGDAELELLDSLDPFSEGISFSVRPPKKSWKQIGNLSGGEKTLSSLALVFALHYYKPTPLYVMDEIDAALDFKNVSIVANYIKERTKDAQFIIISLRNNMFELADRLVGIYKTHDATKSVTINPKLFENAVTIHDSNPSKASTSQSNTNVKPLQDATNRLNR